MIDLRSNVHNLSSYEIKAVKKMQAWMGFEVKGSNLVQNVFQALFSQLP